MHSKCLMTPMQYLSKVNLAAQCTQPGQSGEIISDRACLDKMLLDKPEKLNLKSASNMSLNTFEIKHIFRSGTCGKYFLLVPQKNLRPEKTETN